MQTSITKQTTAETKGANYAENGIIYQSCCTSFGKAKDSLQNLGDSIIKAIEHRIWLGFLHPQTGKFCSFTHTDPDTGEIDDRISFKLFLASDPKIGGLGLTDLNLLESGIKDNPKCLNAVMPLLTDGDSIREANRILEGQGKQPIMQFGKKKEYALKRIYNAPEPLKTLIIDNDIPQVTSLRMVTQLEKLYADHPNFDAITQQLDRLTDSDLDRDEIILKIHEILGLSTQKNLRIFLDSPEDIAKKLQKEIPADTLKTVLDTLQELLKDK